MYYYKIAHNRPATVNKRFHCHMKTCNNHLLRLLLLFRKHILLYYYGAEVGGAEYTHLSLSLQTYRTKQAPYQKNMNLYITIENYWERARSNAIVAYSTEVLSVCFSFHSSSSQCSPCHTITTTTTNHSYVEARRYTSYQGPSYADARIAPHCTAHKNTITTSNDTTTTNLLGYTLWYVLYYSLNS